MFKRYAPNESVQSKSQVKSSVQRAIKRAIVEQYPALEDRIDDILPKKEPFSVAKCDGHIQLIVSSGEVKFFSERDGTFYPMLRTLHQVPDMMPQLRTDRGAIRFVLSGADIMCPGLTSAGASMEDVAEGAPVAIMAEGKEHAMAVGMTTMSTAEIREKNKGIGVRNVHFLNDGLWQHQQLL